MSEDAVFQMKHDINIAIGRQIMLLRKSQGLSGQELARILSVSQQQISRYEIGACKVDIGTLVIMLTHFQVSLRVFFQNVFNSFSERAPHSYDVYRSVFMSDNENELEYAYLIKMSKNNISFSQ